jgi:hypothetical protein
MGEPQHIIIETGTEWEKRKRREWKASIRTVKFIILWVIPILLILGSLSVIFDTTSLLITKSAKDNAAFTLFLGIIWIVLSYYYIGSLFSTRRRKKKPFRRPSRRKPPRRRPPKRRRKPRHRRKSRRRR